VAEARRDYERALPGTLSGRHVLHVGIARLAQVEGDLDGAIRHFAEAARLNPNEPYIHKELASAYVAHGRTDEAFHELAAALLIDARDADAHAAIGQLHLEDGRAADAVAALTRALELKPERHETRYALGTALMRLGRTSAAEQEFAAFRQASQQALERRRRGIAEDVERQQDVQRGGAAR
jgi:Flp pilus assembly protein TadD